MAIQTAVVPASIPYPARTLSNIIKILFRLTPAQIDGLLEQGYVTLNGRTKRQGWAKCDVGDKITVDVVPQSIVAPVKQTKKKTGSRTIEFLYDDEDLSLVNKPANLLTVPTKHREAHTVISLVERRYQSKDPKAKAFCVHRLDRGVSGVLAIAKSLEMAERIRDQFAARKPKRKYIAIVAGKPPEPSGRLVNYLSTDEDLNRIIVPDETRGELAITNYKTHTLFPDASILEVVLETGRRNQIRVQLAEMGTPILGDPRYRPRQAAHWAWPHQRIALHAECLGFKHPRTGEPLYVETQWPQEFRDFIRSQKKVT